MTKETAPPMPAGIKILRYFYALTALFSGLHLVFFLGATDVLWFNLPLPEEISIVVILILVAIPVLLYYGFRGRNHVFWYTAFCYHIFFTFNSLLGAAFTLSANFPWKPILRITGKNLSNLPPASDVALKLFTLFNLNLFMGIIILWYLWRQRHYFSAARKKIT